MNALEKEDKADGRPRHLLDPQNIDILMEDSHPICLCHNKLSNFCLVCTRYFPDCRKTFPEPMAAPHPIWCTVPLKIHTQPPKQMESFAPLRSSDGTNPSLQEVPVLGLWRIVSIRYKLPSMRGNKMWASSTNVAVIEIKIAYHEFVIEKPLTCMNGKVEYDMK